VTNAKPARAPSGSKKRPNLRLTELRYEAGLSQHRLAHFAGVSQGTISLAERGWEPFPRNAGAILDVLESKLGREVAYVEVWPQPGERS
jgi:DNA-binding XRE family transcriptional regulator